MSKNTNISELINYISVDGSGNVVLSSGQLVATQSYVSTAITNLVNSAPSTLDTLNELATALGNDANFATTVAASIGTKQAQLNGTGFVKITGTTISYDNSTYLTTSSASSTYLPLTGGVIASAPASSTANVLTIRNSNSVDNGFVNSVLALDTVVSGAAADIRLGSSNPLGLRIYASTTPLTATPTGAGFQMFTNASPLFPGHMYFDSGANNSAALNFRTAVTGGTITTRLRIEANGTIKLSMLTSNGFVKTSGSDGSLSIDTNTYLTTATASSTYLALAGGTLSGPLTINYGGGHFTLVRNTFSTFSFGTGIGSGISGLVVSDVTAGTNPLIIAQTTGNATFSGEVSVGSSLVLAATNPFIYGGTAVGGVGISNIGGQSYIKIHGASHATLANVIQFVNGSSTSFTVSSAGVTNFNSRVNINGAVDNASYALNVYGDATFNGTRATPAYIYAIRGGDDSKLILKAGSTAGYFSQIDVSGWNGTGTPAYISLNAGSGTGIYISNGNNVGIGTVTASAKLDVYAGADATSNLVLWGQIIRNEGNGAATGYGAGLKLKLSSDGEPYKWAGIAAVAGTGYSNRTDLGLFTAATSTANATEKVRITGDGSFGIGTLAPARTFHVMGQAAFDMTSTGVVIQSNGTVSEIVSYKQTGSTYADLHLRGANLGIVINGTNGNVGIQNSDPQARLHIGAALVNSADVTNGLILKQTSTNETTGIYLERSGERKGYYIYVGGSLDSLNFQRNNSGTKSDTMTLTRDGNVGVGINPFNKMTINTGIGNNLDIFDTGSSFGLGMQAVNGNNTAYKSWDFYATKFQFLNGNVGIGTNDFSDITFGSSALKIAGTRATLGLTSSGTLSTIALIAANNTATAMHMNFESTGAFRWYSYVSGGEIFSLLGNGRLGLGVSSPDARLHVGGPILVSNNNQTYRRAITCYGQTGSYTQIKVIFNKSAWGSVVYDIKVASAGASHHTAGGYYSNPGIGSHVNSINAGGLSMSFVSESQVGTQGQTWTFSGATMIHPIVTVDIGCGNGYQVNPDDIIVQFI